MHQTSVISDFNLGRFINSQLSSVRPRWHAAIHGLWQFSLLVSGICSILKCGVPMRAQDQTWRNFANCPADLLCKYARIRTGQEGTTSTNNCGWTAGRPPSKSHPNIIEYVNIYIIKNYGPILRLSTPPVGSTSFPSICKLLAAFLRSSFVFARSLQHFWLPASHLLGTCYLLDDLRSTHTPSKYLRATYSHIYMCYVSTSYLRPVYAHNTTCV